MTGGICTGGGYRIHFRPVRKFAAAQPLLDRFGRVVNLRTIHTVRTIGENGSRGLTNGTGLAFQTDAIDARVPVHTQPERDRAATAFRSRIGLKRQFLFPGKIGQAGRELQNTRRIEFGCGHMGIGAFCPICP